MQDATEQIDLKEILKNISTSNSQRDAATMTTTCRHNGAGFFHIDRRTICAGTGRGNKVSDGRREIID